MAVAATGTASNGLNYIGNADYRGYLNYLGQNGDANANSLLGLVGNDGNFSNGQTFMAPLSSGINNEDTTDLAAWNAGVGANNTASATTGANQSAINQINSQLGTLDDQQNIGLSNLQNSYQTSANGLDQQNALAQNQYNTQTGQNTQSYLNNRNNIITNTNAQQNALQRLLGINGAGNSSAAYDAVPLAASQYGTQNLNQAQSTYGNNAADLDNAWQDTESNYNTGKNSLQQQLYSGQNSLKSGIASTRASLLGELGQLQNSTAYDPQVNSLLGQITQLSNQYANPVLSAPSLSYTPTTLANYSLGTNQSAAQQASDPGTSGVSTTFLPSLSQQRDQYGNLVSS